MNKGGSQIVGDIKVTSMTSTFFCVFSLSGQAGLFITHGSIRIFLPPGVSMRNVECPSQVICTPFKSIRHLNPKDADTILSVVAAAVNAAVALVDAGLLL
jgi:hypothetical protein